LNITEAILLGIIQGLTEFLPVSSSGHIELGRALLGVETSNNLLLAVVVHSGTALSTMIVYRKDIWEIFTGLFGKEHDERIFAGKIVLSMLPAAAIGLIFESQIEAIFGKYIWLIGICLVFTALLLFLADTAKQTTKNVGFKDSFLIGLAQAVAILPGISRSGATISTAVLLNIDRTKAARFSFLMVLPLILGKMAKDIMSGDLAANPEMTVPLIASFIAALITGIFACNAMIYLVKKSQLRWFAIYCLTIGAIAISTFWWL
jgi:undecaprenyl-diphosphatase